MKTNLLFLLLFAALLSGCVPTYRIIHSGTITIQDHPGPDISEWIENDGGQIIFTPNSTTEFARTREADDVSDAVFDEGGFTIVGGPGVTIIQEGDFYRIYVDSTSVEEPAPLTTEIRPARCLHKNATTFLIGDRLSCHCPNCGMKFNGPCEN